MLYTTTVRIPLLHLKTSLVSLLILIFCSGMVHATETSSMFSGVGYWTVSGGYPWMHALRQITMLSADWSQKIFGYEDYNQKNADFIKRVLKKNIDYPWDTIAIKVLAPSLQLHSMKPFICTQKIIFVNPQFYDPVSDFRSDYEREALILEAGIQISNNYISTSAYFLMLLPLATHALLKFLKEPAERHGISTSYTQSSITHACINYIATKGYFAWQNHVLHDKLCRLMLNSFTLTTCEV